MTTSQPKSSAVSTVRTRLTSMYLVASLACAMTLGCGGRTPSDPTGGGATGGTGGAGGGGGLEDGSAACTAGSVTFHLSATDGRNTSYCVGLNCTEEWVTVHNAKGDPIPLALGCNTTCDDCRPVGCPTICITPKRMNPDGQRLTWDGTYWPDAICGAKQSCRSKRCAAPGKYVARMCATPSTSDAGQFCVVNTMPKCVEVEFEYPSAAPIEGAI